MERVFNDLIRMSNNWSRTAGDFSPETWGAIALCLIAAAYFTMKGSPVRGG